MKAPLLFVSILFFSAITSCYQQQEYPQMSSEAMSPTINPGDFVNPNYSAYTTTNPQRWDIVNYDYGDSVNAEGRKLFYISRVVGLPGETIEIVDSIIKINGGIIPLPGKMAGLTYAHDPREIKVNYPYTIPADHYFLLCDNLPQSLDSRFRGAIHDTAIFARIDPPGPENTGFEEPLSQSHGWIKPAVIKDYDVKLTTYNPHSGKQCAEISSIVEKPDRFGNIMQSIDAKPFRGKTVTYKAFVRTEGSSFPMMARLWFRVDLPDQKMGFFDNMSDRPIMSSEWKEYTITGFIDTNALGLAFGCMLSGKGKAYIDDVTFTAK